MDARPACGARLLSCRAGTMPAVENFALPGQWLITIEATAAVLVLLLAASRPLLSGGRRLGRLCHQVAARPRRVMIAVFVLAAGFTGLSFIVLGPPVPKVTDEYGHLLVADTWLEGRLANPGHPMWRHFDVYALQFPTYASKYPTGQGALLALGGLLGHKAIGPCLGAGILATTFAWAFFRWLRPGWALLGSMLVLLRLAIGSYWHQSYWGGTVGAVGGALLVGALAPGRPKNPAVAGLGLVLLASSRPFEGLVLALPCLYVLLSDNLKRAFAASFRNLAVLTAILLPAAAGLLYSNWRITGDALLFPQAGYVTAYSSEPDFVFQSRFGTGQGEQARAPIKASELAKTLPPTPPEPWFLKALLEAPSRLVRSLYFYLGILGSLAFLLGLVSRRQQRGWLLGTFALTTLAQGLPTFYFPHHASPPTFLFWLLALEGFRRAALSRRPSRGQRPGSRLLLLVLAAELLATTLRFPTLRPGPEDPSRQRQAMVEKLEKIPGHHLVIVEPRSMTDWVWNGAEIDAAKIVWARTAGAEADQKLRDYYPDRQIWRARINTEPPVLEPWQPSP